MFLVEKLSQYQSRREAIQSVTRQRGGRQLDHGNGYVKRFHYRTAVFQSFHTCLEPLLKDNSYF